MTSTHFTFLPALAFAAVVQGKQRAICLPKLDGIQVGDQLVLREQLEADRTRPSGDGWVMRRVTGVLEGEGILPTYAVYSLSTGEDNERAVVAMRRQVHLAGQQGVTVERFFRHLERKQRARRELLRRNGERVARLRAERLEAGRRSLSGDV